MSIVKEQVVRTRVASGATRARPYTFGSGYLVTSGRILTAAHVLVPPDRNVRAPRRGQSCEVQRLGHDRWVWGTLDWFDVDLDLAVVTVKDLKVDGSRPRWGTLDGDEPIRWGAVGFPFAAKDTTSRKPEHAWGETSAITLVTEGKLGLTITSREAISDDAGSGWRGLSGAAVFCEQRLVGVVLDDPSRFAKSLTARRLDAVASNSEFTEVLGFDVALEPVSGLKVDRGLRDTRTILPDRVARFTGREEDLRKLREQPERPSRATVITGMGGIGKTGLALEYAHRSYYRDHAVDLVWWFSASERLPLTAAMTQLYIEVSGEEAGRDSTIGATKLRNWLEACPYRWLLVYDNADEAQILDDLVPRSGRGQVIITSRRSTWSTRDVTVHPLGVLNDAESVQLLGQITGQEDEEGAQDLAEELGGLSLALEQAGAFIAKTSWDYASYLKFLRQTPLKLYGEDVGLGKTVLKVWDTSVDQVVKTCGDLAADVLAVLSYLAADAIPRGLLTQHAVKGEPVLREAPQLEVELALAGLANYSLIVLLPTSITLHRLAQQLTRIRIEETVGGQHAGAAVRLLVAMLSSPTVTQQEMGVVLPNILEASSHATRLGVAPRETINLLNLVRRDVLKLVRVDVGVSVVTRALSLARDVLGPDDPITLTTRRNLAYLQGKLGRSRESVIELRRLLDDAIRVLGAEDPRTLATRSDLASSLWQNGQFKKATLEFQALLLDQKRILGPSDPDTFTSRANICSLLGETRGPSKARAAFQQLFDDETAALGPTHPATLSTRSFIGYWLMAAGRTKQAMSELEAVRLDQTRILGADHPDTLRTRRYLVDCLLSDVVDEEVLEEVEALFEDQKRVLGPDHVDTKWTRLFLASLS